jgi:NAD(P)-dependent dehydrogenase (short-subunit alcohol dehydrogenase family)
MAFTVLISGANRGIGKGLLQRYLIQPNHVVIAANRDPSHPTSQSLNDLPKGEGSRLIIVKVDASSETDASEAVEQLQNSYGIDHLDLVIANAGMSNVWPTVAALRIADLQAHMEANAYGVIMLYQATCSLLKKSNKGPKFIPIGSRAGCMK